MHKDIPATDVARTQMPHTRSHHRAASSQIRIDLAIEFDAFKRSEYCVILSTQSIQLIPLTRIASV